MTRYSELYMKEAQERAAAERKAKAEHESAELLREFIRARKLEDAFMRWLLVRNGLDDVLSTPALVAKHGGTDV